MYNRRQTAKTEERKAARRRREDEAGRLADAVPHLATLRLEVREYQAGASTPLSEHIRRFMIEHAPALFELPCAESRCEEGGHDVTDEILRALRERAPSFEGEHACEGHCGPAPCTRVVRFTGVATYNEGDQPHP